MNEIVREKAQKASIQTRHKSAAEEVDQVSEKWPTQTAILEKIARLTG